MSADLVQSQEIKKDVNEIVKDVPTSLNIVPKNEANQQIQSVNDNKNI